jgi:hypothetical protein
MSRHCVALPSRPPASCGQSLAPSQVDWSRNRKRERTPGEARCWSRERVFRFIEDAENRLEHRGASAKYMLADDSPPAECEDKAEASGDPKQETPMERFKSLTRGLLKVSRKQLDKERERYTSSRSASKRDNGAL